MGDFHDVEVAYEKRGIKVDHYSPKPVLRAPRKPKVEPPPETADVANAD